MIVPIGTFMCADVFGFVDQVRGGRWIEWPRLILWRPRVQRHDLEGGEHLLHIGQELRLFVGVDEADAHEGPLAPDVGGVA